jgi:4-amino-4-deoxy-L-arabinose transferase-like glycosyltransferase
MNWCTLAPDVLREGREFLLGAGRRRGGQLAGVAPFRYYGGMNAARRRFPLGLVAIVVAYLGLGLAYSLFVPVFEAPDETCHLHYVMFVAREHRLPNQAVSEPEVIEGYQPPLYYLLLAPLLRVVPLPPQMEADFRELDKQGYLIYRPGFWERYTRGAHLVQLNPAGPPGSPAAGFVHFRPDRSQEWARGGWRWAVHLLRLPSLLLGLVVVLCTYGLARRAGADRAYAVLAAALVAFLPQFLFIAGVINNDNLANALSALTLFAWVAFWKSGLTAPRAALLGALCGLALLSKATTAFLLPLSLVACYATTRQVGPAVRAGGVILLCCLVVLSPMLVRDYLVYGHALGGAAPASIGGLDPHLAPGHLGTYFLNFFPKTLILSFRATFGLMDVLGSLRGALLYYAILGSGLAACALGLLRRGRGEAPEEEPRALLGWLFLSGLAILLPLIYLNLHFPQAQGRYLFPALPAAATLAALGIRRLTSRWPWAARGAPAVLAAMLALTALYELVHVILPTYWR